MYDHISALGSCVNSPQSPVPEVSCTTDTDCHDGISCSVDTCNAVTKQCVNTLKNNCCGNLICEANESVACSDCGPFVLSSPSTGQFTMSGGVMFDIEAINAVAISGLTFHFNNGPVVSCNTDLYTADKSYIGIEYDRPSWTPLISDQAISITCETQFSIQLLKSLCDTTDVLIFVFIFSRGFLHFRRIH